MKVDLVQEMNTMLDLLVEAQDTLFLVNKGNSKKVPYQQENGVQGTVHVHPEVLVVETFNKITDFLRDFRGKQLAIKDQGTK